MRASSILSIHLYSFHFVSQPIIHKFLPFVSDKTTLIFVFHQQFFFFFFLMLGNQHLVPGDVKSRDVILVYVVMLMNSRQKMTVDWTYYMSNDDRQSKAVCPLCKSRGGITASLVKYK